MEKLRSGPSDKSQKWNANLVHILEIVMHMHRMTPVLYGDTFFLAKFGVNKIGNNMLFFLFLVQRKI